jgi:hypothetical protein
MNLKEVLENIMKDKIQNEIEPQYGALSSSNAVLYDITTQRYLSESSDHCPRMALARRQYNLQEEKSIKAYISNNVGRQVEEFFKGLLKDNLQFVSEEEAQVKIELDGEILLTSRPDAIINYLGALHAVELKSIQSNTTAKSVLVDNTPKLGALIQLVINMYGHSIDSGFIVYIAPAWYKGQFYGRRDTWRTEPEIKTFFVDSNLTTGEKESMYLVEGRKSIVSVDRLLDGAIEYLRAIKSGVLPSKPKWVNIWGDKADFDGCGFCPFQSSCERADALQDVGIENWVTNIKKGLEV